jgi:galactokinase/galacturonokinase
LRQVPREVFEQYKGRLPDPWRKRAEHWFGEYERVEHGVKAWRDGNLEEYGRLVFASGRSSIELWETGSPELKRLYEIMTETKGIYGGRFSGAGFKGCCMALINPDLADSIAAKVTDDYLKSFPQLAGKFSVHICDTDNGVGNCKA